MPNKTTTPLQSATPETKIKAGNIKGYKATYDYTTGALELGTKINENNIEDVLNHEYQHFAQNLGLSPEERLLTPIKSNQVIAAGKVPLIEMNATMMEKKPDRKNGYYSIMTPEQKKKVDNWSQKSMSKAWKEFKKIRTPNGFDFNSYFKGENPDEAYEKYKTIASKYINLVYRMKSYEYAAQINEHGPIHKKNINLLRTLYEKANMIEKYIRNTTNKNYVFVDLGVLNRNEHENESAADYLMSNDRAQRVVWMPSEKFLEMAYQLTKLDYSDLHSIGYSHNRLKTGRIAPPSLNFSYNGAEQMFAVEHHQGRHRNLANMLLNEENEIPVIISFPKENMPQFNTFRKYLRAGYPTKKLVIPQNSGKTNEELMNDVYERYSETPAAEELYQTNRKPNKYLRPNILNAQIPHKMSPKKLSRQATIYPKMYPEGKDIPQEDVTPEAFEATFDIDENMKKCWVEFKKADIKISRVGYTYYDPHTNTIFLHGSDLDGSKGGTSIEDLINHETQHSVQFENALTEKPRKQTKERRINRLENKYLDAKLHGNVPIIERDAMYLENEPEKNPNYPRLTEEQKKKLHPSL